MSDHSACSQQSQRQALLLLHLPPPTHPPTQSGLQHRLPKATRCKSVLKGGTKALKPGSSTSRNLLSPSARVHECETQAPARLGPQGLRRRVCPRTLPAPSVTRNPRGPLTWGHLAPIAAPSSLASSLCDDLSLWVSVLSTS